MRNEDQNIEYKESWRDARKHASYPRNKNVAYAFFKAGFIESWGRGYKKIREELDKAGMPMPTIQEVDGGVMAVMKRFSMEEIIAQRSEEMPENVGSLSEECRENVGKIPGVELSKRQCSIYAMIKENPYTSAPIMAEALKVTKRTIERDLSKMQKAGIIRHEGSSYAGIWVTLEQKND